MSSTTLDIGVASGTLHTNEAQRIIDEFCSTDGALRGSFERTTHEVSQCDLDSEIACAAIHEEDIESARIIPRKEDSTETTFGLQREDVDRLVEELGQLATALFAHTVRVSLRSAAWLQEQNERMNALVYDVRTHLRNTVESVRVQEGMLEPALAPAYRDVAISEQDDLQDLYEQALALQPRYCVTSLPVTVLDVHDHQPVPVRVREAVMVPILTESEVERVSVRTVERTVTIAVPDSVSMTSVAKAVFDFLVHGPPSVR